MTRRQPRNAVFAIAYHRHKDNEFGFPEEFGFCGPPDAPTTFMSRDGAEDCMERKFGQRKDVCYSIVQFKF